MEQSIENTGWKTTAILVARFIMAALFAMGVADKIDNTQKVGLAEIGSR